MTEIELKHKNEYGHKPAVVCSSPGKVIISGEHTEYNDGVLISAAINRYCHISISKREDNHLRVYSANLEERKKVSMSNIKYKREDRWANYIKGVASSIIQNGATLSGMNITILSDIPSGIGLGASTAMCLAVTCALKKLYKLDMSWLNIVEACRYSEAVFMGLYTGLNDAMTMFFSKKDSLFFLDAATLEYQNIDISRQNDKLVLLNPGVNNGDVELDFATDREGLYDLASVLSKGRNNHSLRNYRVSDIRGCLKVQERIKRKAIFIVEEIKRSMDERQILRAGDTFLFGRYMVRSHEGLRDLFESTCPEVDWLIKRGVETEGIWGGKSSGENSSGIIVFIMNDKGMANFQENIEEYDKIFGFKAKFIEIEVVDGVAVSDPDILN